MFLLTSHGHSIHAWRRFQFRFRNRWQHRVRILGWRRYRQVGVSWTHDNRKNFDLERSFCSISQCAKLPLTIGTNRCRQQRNEEDRITECYSADGKIEVFDRNLSGSRLENETITNEMSCLSNVFLFVFGAKAYLSRRSLGWTQFILREFNLAGHRLIWWVHNNRSWDYWLNSSISKVSGKRNLDRKSRMDRAFGKDSNVAGLIDIQLLGIRK